MPIEVEKPFVFIHQCLAVWQTKEKAETHTVFTVFNSTILNILGRNILVSFRVMKIGKGGFFFSFFLGLASYPGQILFACCYSLGSHPA